VVFTQDALLLIGHGSVGVADAARPLLAHADSVRDTGCFAETAVGMLNGSPNIVDVFNTLTAPVVQIVPFFMEDGYFTRVAIPDVVAPLASAKRLIHYRPPIGTHTDIASLIDARLSRHCEMFGIEPKFLAVLLAAHGSSRAPGRAALVRRHAARIEASGRFNSVRTAFLEESPFVPEILAATRGYQVAVIGYFANAGVHVTQDLPRMIADERVYRGTNWPPVHDLGMIGDDKNMPKLIMDLVTKPA
jgi:sirohydrochlorin cobaltochelatase